MTGSRWLAAAILVLLLAACSAPAPVSPTATTPPAPATGPTTPPTGSPALSPPALTPGATVTIDLSGRPFQLHAPESHDPAQPAPLVVLLHGFTSSAAEQESYFRLTAESDRRGFLYAMPDGTSGQQGNRFWNATDACCDFQDTGVDDSAYLRALIDLLVSAYPVDPQRVFLVGHSNGGFMAHRMACDHPGVVAGIVSLAGMGPATTAECTTGPPVSVLQIHGTEDPIIPYEGGAILGREIPSVAGTLSRWREHNGCTDQADESDPPLDLDRSRAGAETTVTTYANGCRDQHRVVLWTIQDGGHVPPLTPDFAPAIIDFLYDRA